MEKEMKKFEVIVTCNFGVEAILKRELQDLGMEIVKVEDGRITYKTDMNGVAKTNLWLRTAGRIYIKLAEFEATTFEELFQGVKKIDWSEWIGEKDIFPVKKAVSLKSKLFSTPDIQKITKKAVVENLKEKYKVNWFDETGVEYPIYVFIHKDVVTVTMDTSGDSLYKRGYKVSQTKAPIKETLAAFMVMMSPWKYDRDLIDPFCGSGTILIEAAMRALNIAPGLNRSFGFENWSQLDKEEWKKIKKDAYTAIKHDLDFKIQGYDIDSYAIKAARANAEAAGVEEHIHFQLRNVADLSSTKKYGFIITNPPYGERLEDKASVEELYRLMGKVFRKLDTWSYYIITSYERFENPFGKKASKKRKIYNGMLKTDLYQYFGPKPPRKTDNK